MPALCSNIVLAKQAPSMLSSPVLPSRVSFSSLCNFNFTSQTFAFCEIRYLLSSVHTFSSWLFSSYCSHNSPSFNPNSIFLPFHLDVSLFPYLFLAVSLNLLPRSLFLLSLLYIFSSRFCFPSFIFPVFPTFLSYFCCAVKIALSLSTS
jgi:hypothetical protein